jgi:hypothetical protein
MTPDLKEKIKASMMEYLTAHGYPNIPNQQIIQMLPELWKKLANEGLLVGVIARGFQYDHFVNIAVHKMNEVETLEQIMKHFRREP